MFDVSQFKSLSSPLVDFIIIVGQITGCEYLNIGNTHDGGDIFVAAWKSKHVIQYNEEKEK